MVIRFCGDQQRAGTVASPPPYGPIVVEKPWYFKNGTIVVGCLLGILPGLLLLAVRPPRSRRKTTISLSLAGLVIVLISIGDSGTSTEESSSLIVVKTTTTVRQSSYKDFLKPGLELAPTLKPLCKKTAAIFATKNSKYDALISSGTKNQDDPYAAERLLKKVPWWGMSGLLENATVGQVMAEIPPLFTILFTDAGIAESKTLRGEALFSRQIGEDLIGLCDLAAVNTDIVAKARRLSTLRSVIQNAARNVPWFPRGYTEFEAGIAQKWLSVGEYSCSYSGVSCWGMSVISKNGCGNLYVEITILDTAGNNIGFTNDSASGLQPGQKAKLIFDTFEDEAKFARVAEINCY